MARLPFPQLPIQVFDVLVGSPRLGRDYPNRPVFVDHDLADINASLARGLDSRGQITLAEMAGAAGHRFIRRAVNDRMALPTWSPRPVPPVASPRWRLETVRYASRH